MDDIYDHRQYQPIHVYGCLYMDMYMDLSIDLYSVLHHG